MYRQNHSSFGKPSYRVSSLPENYSGNAFSVKSKEKEEDTAENLIVNDTSPAFEAEKEIEQQKENGRRKDLQPSFASLGIAEDTAVLFLVLLVLAAGGGEKDDGALLMILLLLLL